MANTKEKQMETSQLGSIKKDFFFDMEEGQTPEVQKEIKKTECLFSTDSLS